jgi:hypothetical protein
MSVATFHVGSWLASVTQLLDDHHLVVLSDEPETQQAFASCLQMHLGGFGSTQVIHLDGLAIDDVGDLAHQLAIGLGIGVGAGDVDDVVEMLRTQSEGIQRRYLVWTGADEMLERDVATFSELVNCMFGVAGEHEYVSDGPLLLQRVVFTGGAKLGAYAEEENGQFSNWLIGDDANTFWHVLRCLRRPPVLTYRLDG